MPQPARQPPSYQIEVPAYSGPLDLLLHLIEREELDVTAISLTRVTEQYLVQVESLKEDKIEHLIDFLVIGARLVLIKSRALLPQPPAIPDDEEEEDPAQALIRQLRLYKQFKSAAGWLHGREEQGLRTYLRVVPPPRLESKLDTSGLTAHTLRDALRTVLERAETLEESVDVVQPRQITVEGQVSRLQNELKRRARVSFGELLSPEPDRLEIAVTLLAILEMIKRHEVIALQPYLFGPIEIEAPTNSETSPDSLPTRQS